MTSGPKNFTMSIQTAAQPDISYQPDQEKYLLRVERLKAKRPQHPSLPAGFPKQLNGGLVWEGADFENEAQWTLTFEKSQLEEIEAALRHFQCKVILQRRTEDDSLDKAK